VAAETELGAGIVSRVELTLSANTDDSLTLEATIVLKRKPRRGVALDVIVRLTDALRDALGDKAELCQPYVRFLTEADLATEESDD
jgi:hypothetical protein